MSPRYTATLPQARLTSCSVTLPTWRPPHRASPSPLHHGPEVLVVAAVIAKLTFWHRPAPGEAARTVHHRPRALGHRGPLVENVEKLGDPVFVVQLGGLIGAHLRQRVPQDVGSGRVVREAEAAVVRIAGQHHLSTLDERLQAGAAVDGDHRVGGVDDGVRVEAVGVVHEEDVLVLVHQLLPRVDLPQPAQRQVVEARSVDGQQVLGRRFPGVELDDQRLPMLHRPLRHRPDDMRLRGEALPQVEDDRRVRVHLGQVRDNPLAAGLVRQPRIQLVRVGGRRVHHHLGLLRAAEVLCHLRLRDVRLDKLHVAPVKVALHAAVHTDAAHRAPHQAPVVDGRLQRHHIEPLEDCCRPEACAIVVVALRDDDHIRPERLQLLERVLNEAGVLIQLLPDDVQVRTRLALHLGKRPLLAGAYCPRSERPQTDLAVVLVVELDLLVRVHRDCLRVPCHLRRVLLEYPAWLVHQLVR
mmetsp:Transcript_42583/g.110426  ORF Transcript_42583/g.110426 Transcript_42583/m.110426 type:complete len:469 (-) Transcript_42583:336-1742(-)